MKTETETETETEILRQRIYDAATVEACLALADEAAVDREPGCAEAAYLRALSLDPACEEARLRLQQLRDDLGDTEFELTSPGIEPPLQLTSTGDRELEHAPPLATAPASPVVPAPNAITSPPTVAAANTLAPLLLQRFVGRDNVFAVQWQANDRTGYRPIHQPFDLTVAKRHLLGQETVGLYVVRHNQCVRFAAIDIDVRAPNHEPLAPPQIAAIALPVLQTLCGAAEDGGLHPITEWSGYKGYHLWFFFEDEVPAALARKTLCRLAETAEPLPSGVSLEIFPKQDRVAQDGLGNLIKLPLGRHARTNMYSHFVGADGQVLSPGYALKNHRFSRIVEQPPVSLGRLPCATQQHDANSLLQNLAARCSVVNALHDKARRTRNLTHDERVVLLYTLAQGGPCAQQALHAIIGNCTDYDHAYTQNQIDHVRPNPISCPRIRQRLADTHPCDHCAFSSPALGYPTPLLHVLPDLTVDPGTKGSSARSATPRRKIAEEGEHHVVYVRSQPGRRCLHASLHIPHRRFNLHRCAEHTLTHDTRPLQQDPAK